MNVLLAIPCRNEALTVAAVVTGLRAALPSARVVVFDNASTDGTADVARVAGAAVVHVPKPGKGHVVRAIRDTSEATVTLIIDGDDTYDAAHAAALVHACTGGVGLVNGARVPVSGALSPVRAVGNRLISAALRRVVGSTLRDPLSGYKAMSASFLKSFPAHSTGFEVETELVLHAVKNRCVTIELPTTYRARPPGSESKLSAVKDGWRIAKTIARHR